MKVLYSKSTNIFKNLALERILYRQKELSEPVLFFYRNDKSIIIGRNQNPWKECKIEQIIDSKTNLCRRFSGGGAVYQDLGNLCFSFIKPVHGDKAPFEEKEVNNAILVNAFKSLGMTVEAQGRNDLMIQGNLLYILTPRQTWGI